MTSSINTSLPPLPQLGDRIQSLRDEHQHAIWVRVDRLFAGLLLFEWLIAIGLALVLAPYTWAGAQRTVHPHVLAALVLGMIIVIPPVILSRTDRGRPLTRYVIAIAQMSMSGLLIHIGNGRIEMHFHIFGSLAFLSFYREWRVIVIASAVTALDHVCRGAWAPESIYGAAHASPWRSVEHVGWVVFEDVFLIFACLQGVREIHGIATHRANLEESHRLVEQKVQARTQELKAAQDELLRAARSAGMAEIATSVLHNVGNVLNSVNVAASVVAEKLRDSEVRSLSQVGGLINEHQADLGTFMTQDERGKMLPQFINDLAQCLVEEQAAILDEVVTLSAGIDHIKQIVSAQQSVARESTVRSMTDAGRLVESAMMLSDRGLVEHIEIDRQLEETPACLFDRHKVLQILINLLNNARQAVAKRPVGQRKITVSLARAQVDDREGLQFTVSDNGVGIAPENLVRVLSHGFTTKPNGHGFGLHSAANAAREMKGSLRAESAGIDRGATFTLQIPIEPAEETAACQL